MLLAQGPRLNAPFELVECHQRVLFERVLGNIGLSQTTGLHLAQRI